MPRPPRARRQGRRCPRPTRSARPCRPAPPPHPPRRARAPPPRARPACPSQRRRSGGRGTRGGCLGSPGSATKFLIFHSAPAWTRIISVPTVTSRNFGTSHRLGLRDAQRVRGGSPAGERAQLGDGGVHQHEPGGDPLPRGGGAARLQPAPVVWGNDGGAALGGEDEAGAGTGTAPGADRLEGDPGGPVLRGAGGVGGGRRTVGNRGSGERAAA